MKTRVVKIWDPRAFRFLHYVECWLPMFEDEDTYRSEGWHPYPDNGTTMYFDTAEEATDAAKLLAEQPNKWIGPTVVAEFGS